MSSRPGTRIAVHPYQGQHLLNYISQSLIGLDRIPCPDRSGTSSLSPSSPSFHYGLASVVSRPMLSCTKPLMLHFQGAVLVRITPGRETRLIFVCVVGTTRSCFHRFRQRIRLQYWRARPCVLVLSRRCCSGAACKQVRTSFSIVFQA